MKNKNRVFCDSLRLVFFMSLGLAPASLAGATPADQIAPTVVSVSVNTPTKISIYFSKKMESGSAQSVGNYTITRGMAVLSAALSADAQTVTLTTSELDASVTYMLNITDVRDQFENTLVPAQFFISLPDAPYDGLIHAWLFEEELGTEVFNHVTPEASGNFSAAPAAPIRSTGQVGGALTFDGINDRVVLPAFNLTGDQFTLSLWMNLASQTIGDARLFSKASGTSANDHILMLSTFDTRALRFRLKPEGGDTVTLIGNSQSFAFDTWHHGAVIYDGASLSILIDGNEVANTAIAGNIAQSDYGVALGNQPEGAGEKAMDGILDQVRIYDRALSSQEIDALRSELPPQIPSTQNYDDFATEYFSAGEQQDAKIIGAGMDPDQDGLANIVEYFLREDPTTMGVNPITVAFNSEQFVFTYDRLVNPGDIRWMWESSADLINWQLVNPDSERLVEFEDMGETVNMESVFRRPSDQKKFYRLKVSDDIAAPSIPSGLQTEVNSSEDVTLNWSASNDNSEVVGYNIYRDGVLRSQVTAPSYVDREIEAGNTYHYRVSAYDYAGNESERSVSVVAVIPGVVSPGIAAFPGAEGYGALSIGGRGGQVVKVTNLNDAGPGSFREALSLKEPRIIVFQVGGVIELQSFLGLPDGGGRVTIAGQTAPGGITLTGATLGNLYGTKVTDVIVRHLRVRGLQNMTNTSQGGDCMSWYDSERVIMDHVSLSWSCDELLDIIHSTEVTLQYSVLTEAALAGQGGCDHSEGGHNYGVSTGYSDANNLTFHHNMFAHLNKRGPLIQSGSDNPIHADIRNNINYNMDTGIHLVTTNGQDVFVNMVGVYFQPGPYNYEANRSLFATFRFPDPEGQFHFHIADSFNGTFDTESPEQRSDPLDLEGDIWLWNGWSSRAIASPTPIAMPGMPEVTTHSVFEGRDIVLAKAGAFPRDAVDERAIQDFLDGTGVWGKRDANLLTADMGNPAPADDDGDGMANVWETANGLDPSTDDSAGDFDGDGYTNIEEYIDDLAEILVDQPTANPTGGVEDWYNANYSY